jgi:hypothetical protein
MPTPIIKVQGFFISCDKYNRAKLMFLDDYDETTSMSFVKKYILAKSKKISGNNPLVENDTCFLIKCHKHSVGYTKDIRKNSDFVITPMSALQQHKVECVVKVNEYNFVKDGDVIEGWNLNLIKMNLLEM